MSNFIKLPPLPLLAHVGPMAVWGPLGCCYFHLKCDELDVVTHEPSTGSRNLSGRDRGSPRIPTFTHAGCWDDVSSNKTAAKAVSKYQEAIKSFQQYQEKVPEDLRAQEAIVACELAIDWTENPSRYAVTNMKKINSKYDDRMPCFGDKKQTSLYFTTARKGVNGRKLSAQTGQYFTDVWVTEIEKQKKKNMRRIPGSGSGQRTRHRH